VQCNENATTLTETKASIEASNSQGRSTVSILNQAYKKKRQIQQRFANVSTALKSLVSE